MYVSGALDYIKCVCVCACVRVQNVCLLMSINIILCMPVQVEIGESRSGSSLGAGSLVTVLRHVIKEHGYSGLFTGLTPRVAKIAPACAIMIASYEAGKEYFAQYNLRN